MTNLGVFLRLFPVVGASAAGFAGCGAANPVASDPSWTQVAEKTSCEAMNPVWCRGIYGFTLTPDGHYVVGPADDGTRIEGTISDSERTRLSGDVAHVAGRLAGTPQCGGPGGVPGVGDEVDLTDAGNAVWKVYELTLNGSCTLGPRDAANRLHDDLQALMASYYPRPFPN